jgi:hypothetical protein
MMYLPLIAAAASIGTAIGSAIGYCIGHREGVYAEQARAAHIFSSALCVVRSGAFYSVWLRILGRITDEEMRAELLQEADHRARERLQRR